MTEYRLTIQQTSRGRKRKGVQPEARIMVIYQQLIEQHQIADIVRLVNAQKPNVRVSSDGVPAEIVSPGKEETEHEPG